LRGYALRKTFHFIVSSVWAIVFCWFEHYSRTTEEHWITLGTVTWNR